MHSRFERSRKKENGFFEKWGFGFVVLPVLLAVAMITFSVIQPKSNWIADIVAAEFPSKSVTSGDAPTQIAKPETQTRTVSAK